MEWHSAAGSRWAGAAEWVVVAAIGTQWAGVLGSQSIVAPAGVESRSPAVEGRRLEGIRCIGSEVVLGHNPSAAGHMVGLGKVAVAAAAGHRVAVQHAHCWRRQGRSSIPSTWRQCVSDDLDRAQDVTGSFCRHQEEAFKLEFGDGGLQGAFATTPHQQEQEDNCLEL